MGSTDVNGAPTSSQKPQPQLMPVDQLSILIFLLPLPNSDLAAEHPADPATACASNATTSFFPDTSLYRAVIVQTTTVEDQI